MVATHTWLWLFEALGVAIVRHWPILIVRVQWTVVAIIEW